MKYLAALLAAPAIVWGQAATPLDMVFDRMYRNDFDGAKSLAQSYINTHPGDPLGYSVQSSAYLFAELDRLSILESEFFGDDKRIADKKGVKPDPVVRGEFLASVGKAKELAQKKLQSEPQDRNSLFALCIATGVQMDYQALIEKKQIGSLGLAKESNAWAVKLLAIDPSFHDAYLTTGLSEYLLGSLPFFVKWFVKFDKTEGSKTQAVKNLELVAKSGRYFRPFAKVLLAVVHLREKRPALAEARLGELVREFPENKLFRKEFDKLAKRNQLVTAGRP